MRTVDRILATSDLHGQNTRFINLLKKTGYEPDQDLLVVCGDLIDRGGENLDCLAACMKLQQQGAILLKGNHEQFLESSLVEMLTTDTWRTRPSDSLYAWIKHNGGARMYEEIKELSSDRLTEILQFVRSLPLYLTAGRFIFSHAGANTAKPVETNTENELVWMEETFPFCPAYAGKVIVFGHIPTWLLYHDSDVKKRKQARIWYDRQHQDKICLDCGGVFGGRLAAIELPSCREFYG